MMQFDADGDGKVSKQEAPERMQEGFDAMDTNKDGALDQAEIKALREMMRAKFRGGGGPGGGPAAVGSAGLREDRNAASGRNANLECARLVVAFFLSLSFGVAEERRERPKRKRRKESGDKSHALQSGTASHELRLHSSDLEEP